MFTDSAARIVADPESCIVTMSQDEARDSDEITSTHAPVVLAEVEGATNTPVVELALEPANELNRIPTGKPPAIS